MTPDDPEIEFDPAENRAIDKALDDLAKVETYVTDDPEAAHSEVDNIVLKLLQSLAPEVAEKIDNLKNTSPWWASA